MKYFLKTLSLLMLIAVALFGYVAFYQYGCESGLKQCEKRYQDGIKAEKARAKAFRDSIFDNNAWNNGIPKFVKKGVK